MKYPDEWTENVMTNQLYDYDSGNVEAPTGWFCIAGANVVTEDSKGFVYRYTFATDVDANQAYAAMEERYSHWDES